MWWKIFDAATCQPVLAGSKMCKHWCGLQLLIRFLPGRRTDMPCTLPGRRGGPGVAGPGNTGEAKPACPLIFVYWPLYKMDDLLSMLVFGEIHRRVLIKLLCQFFPD